MLKPKNHLFVSKVLLIFIVIVTRLTPFLIFSSTYTCLSKNASLLEIKIPVVSLGIFVISEQPYIITLCFHAGSVQKLWLKMGNVDVGWWYKACIKTSPIIFTFSHTLVVRFIHISSSLSSLGFVTCSKNVFLKDQRRHGVPYKIFMLFLVISLSISKEHTPHHPSLL